MTDMHQPALTWGEAWQNIRNYQIDWVLDPIILGSAIALPAFMTWLTNSGWQGYLQNLLLYLLGLMAAFWFFKPPKIWWGWFPMGAGIIVIIMYIVGHG